MNCADTRRIAASWEQGELLSDTDVEEALSHALSCGSCRSEHPVFAALAARDSNRARREPPSEEAVSLADRVMADIGAMENSVPVRMPRARRVPRQRIAFAAALAACAVFASGLFSRNAQTVEIRFVLDAPNAKSVFLAGDFSSWETKGLELNKTAEGLWERKVRLRRGKSYTYNFIVDGKSWVVDPSAAERVDDGFGGESALIRL